MMTLDDYNKQILNEATIQYIVCKIDEDLARANILTGYMFVDGKPPTKYERFKYRIEDYRQRVKDIWTILKGDDIHKNCGW